MQSTTQLELQALPLGPFDDSITLDDPPPFEGWEPSAEQIRDERERAPLPTQFNKGNITLPFEADIQYPVRDAANNGPDNKAPGVWVPGGLVSFCVTFPRPNLQDTESKHADELGSGADCGRVPLQTFRVIPQTP